MHPQKSSSRKLGGRPEGGVDDTLEEIEMVKWDFHGRLPVSGSEISRLADITLIAGTREKARKR